MPTVNPPPPTQEGEDFLEHSVNGEFSIFAKNIGIDEKCFLYILTPKLDNLR